MKAARLKSVSQVLFTLSRTFCLHGFRIRTPSFVFAAMRERVRKLEKEKEIGGVKERGECGREREREREH